MISLIRSGDYQLVETKADTKILRLDDDTYAWVKAEDIGEILVYSTKDHEFDTLLSSGEYRMYNVEGEPKIADLIHLELEAGIGNWQSYLLLTGLPSDDRKRTRIIPTKELITKL